MSFAFQLQKTAIIQRQRPEYVRSNYGAKCKIANLYQILIRTERLQSNCKNLVTKLGNLTQFSRKLPREVTNCKGFVNRMQRKDNVI